MLPSLLRFLHGSSRARLTAGCVGLTLLLATGARPASALTTVSLGSGGLTAGDLAAALAGPGVTVSNATFTGAAAQAARFSADTQLGFGNGVVLGSGNAAALGPNSSTTSGVNHGGAGNASLTAGNVDAAVLEFDFVPSTANVTMRWLFASDEFGSATPRDDFGVWVNGTRVSLLPSTGTPVATVSGINASFVSETVTAKHYLRDNDRTTANCGSTYAACRFDLQADGVSVAFGISAAVTAGATNHIKIALADTGDGTVDSWLYVEAGSLRALESCSNSSDDDSDGLPDATDPDCATLSVTPIGTAGVTAQSLVDGLAGVGVGTSSVTFTGSNAQGGLFSNDVVLGLGSGILLSTGNATSAVGSNDGDRISQDFAVNSGGGEYDRAILSFSFVPTTPRVIFRYVFGSEEYDEFASTAYNDRFSLKVNGVNRALLPNGTTAITINNVNGGNTNSEDGSSPAAKLAVNPAFFRGNDNCGRPGGCLYKTELDGMTTVLTLEATVNPNVTNTLSIEIADVADGRYDSWIFLQADSLVSVEVCANSVDDDGDTLIDAADPDCNVCGDGLTRGAETCDDGNTTNGDCCSASCQYEETGSTCGSATATDCNQPDTCDGAGICLPNLRSPGFACTTDGNSCSQDICDSFGSCTHATPETAGVLCRAVAGDCDVAETCDGSTLTCPADALATIGTECRASAGACDPAETCTGSGAACPADALVPIGTVCRDLAGACDVAETCTGAATACPADALASAGTECRGSAGACDVAETCTGAASGCPADILVTAGTECRGSAGACDVAETCTGAASACPADGLVTAGTECRASADACDMAETCNGASSACPVDGKASSGTACGDPTATDCSAADSCDGAGACLTNSRSLGTACADDANECTADLCDGAGSCTHGAGNAGVTCRAAAGECDAAETCDGVATTCPGDGGVEAGTPCGDDGTTECSAPDTCDGTGTCLSNHGTFGTGCTADSDVCSSDICDGAGSCTHPAGNAGTICRGATDVCDTAEVCTGVEPGCPVDAKAGAGTSCGDPGVTECGAADICDGNGACGTENMPAGTACSDDSNPCTADTCDGAGSCDHAPGNAGSECRSAAGDCDAAETCDGENAACPADVLTPAGATCRATAGDCDAAETCDGASASCPADVVVAAGTTCREPAGACDLVEACDGASATCPTDFVADAGTECRAAAGACDVSEACDGDSVACAADVIVADFETCDDSDSATRFEYCEAGVCGNGIVPVDLIKLFVWPTFGEGSIVKAKAGFVDSFVFDLTEGVIVRTRDGAGQTASLVFTPSECSLLPGNRIQCTRENASGIVSDRIRVSPRRGGQNRMDLYVNSLDLDFPVIGPVTLDMELKGRRYGSQGANCTGGEPPATRVTCKP